ELKAARQAVEEAEQALQSAQAVSEGATESEVGSGAFLAAASGRHPEAEDVEGITADLAQARARIDELEQALAVASGGPAAVNGSEPGAGGREAELEAEIADMEERLELTEVRVRRAYAAAESAEAALRFAKERGEVIVSDPAMDREVTRLRAEVEALKKKLYAAERIPHPGPLEESVEVADAARQALAAASGHEPRDEAVQPPDLSVEAVNEVADAAPATVDQADSTQLASDGDSTTPDPAGLLRSRLASAATVKKGRRPNDNEWR
ncbi:MAG: hypothetical protein ACXWK9_14870, partial [Myxococcaceae bacterium]